MLDKTTFNFLKKMYHLNQIPLSEFPDFNIFHLLLEHKFIERSDEYDDYTGETMEKYESYSITSQGKAYIESVAKDNLRFRIPVIISISAIVISIASALISLIALLE